MSIREGRRRRRRAPLLQIAPLFGLWLAAACGRVNGCAEEGGPIAASRPPRVAGEEASVDPLIGRFIWHELITADPGPVVEFYTDVVGWTVSRNGRDDIQWLNHGTPVAGAPRLRDWSPGPHSYWKPTVLVRDVDATVRLAANLGGSIRVPPADVPNGRYATLADPKGPIVDIFSSSAPVTPRDGREPGGWSWNEYEALDSAATLAFYGKLFGWVARGETAVSASTSYIRLGRAGDPGGDGDAGSETSVGGIRTDPAIPTNGWLFYVEIVDLDPAVSRAVARHGRVIVPPLAIEGGRMAVLADPQGAAFALHESARPN